MRKLMSGKITWVTEAACSSTPGEEEAQRSDKKSIAKRLIRSSSRESSPPFAARSLPPPGRHPPALFAAPCGFPLGALRAFQPPLSRPVLFGDPLFHEAPS